MVAKTKTKYEADSGTVHKITIATANVTAAGAAPGGAVDSPVRAKVSRSKREYGLAPRGVRLGRTVGTAPDTFVKYAFLPILTPTAFDAITIDQSITYSGNAYKVISKIPEAK